MHNIYIHMSMIAQCTVHILESIHLQFLLIFLFLKQNTGNKEVQQQFAIKVAEALQGPGGAAANPAEPSQNVAENGMPNPYQQPPPHQSNQQIAPQQNQQNQQIPTQPQQNQISHTTPQNQQQQPPQTAPNMIRHPHMMPPGQVKITFAQKVAINLFFSLFENCHI